MQYSTVSDLLKQGKEEHKNSHQNREQVKISTALGHSEEAKEEIVYIQESSVDEDYVGIHQIDIHVEKKSMQSIEDATGSLRKMRVAADGRAS